MRYHLTISLFAAWFAAGALAGEPADAGPGEWTSLGPFGGGITVLAVDPRTPTTLYAGTNGGGVFKSLDGGGHWTAASDGLGADAVIQALAIDPQTPATLYAAMWEGGVFKSTDGGGHWTAVNHGIEPASSPFVLPGLGVETVAIDPRAPATLYAGRFCNGVVKSTDGGGRWSPVNHGLPEPEDNGIYLCSATVRTLTIDPQSPATLYAGVCDPNESGEMPCTGAILYKSADGGGLWKPADAGLPRHGEVEALAIDPQTPGTLYAGTRFGLYKSTDGAGQWVAVNGGLAGRRVVALVVDPQSPSILYAGTADGLYKSTDGGGLWTAMGEDLAAAAGALAIDPQTPSTLYAGTSDGLHKSTDGAAHWAAVNEGLSSRLVLALAVDPQNPDTLYARTRPGELFRSTDRGSRWTQVSEEWFCGGATLAINPSGTLYAGGAGVCRSTDGGAHWTDVSEGLPGDAFVDALAIDPQTPSTLYVGTFAGMYKSTAGGGQWSPLTEGLPDEPVYALAVDPLTPGTLYAGTAGAGVYKSTDGGARWNAAHDGLTENPESAFVTALAIDPQDPATLYAGVLDPEIADCACGTVFRSEDGGEHWSAVHEGLSHGYVNALEIDRHSPDTVYAGVWSEGVFRRTERDGPWSAIGPGHTSVQALAIDPASSVVYAGTRGRGVFALQLDDEDGGDPGGGDPGGGDPGGGEASVLSLHGGRFEVKVDWRDFEAGTGAGRVASVGAESDDSGVFYFFHEDNWELLVKVIDGCGFNGRYWVYAAATTNVEYTLTVTDVEAGEVKTYDNPLGRASPAVTDSAAFDTCP